MKKLLDKIKVLEKISSQLEPSKSKKEYYNKQLFEYADSFIDSLKEKNGYFGDDSNLKGLAIDENTVPFKKLLKTYTKEVVNKGVVASSGSHLGHIPGGGIYTAALGDYLADITNEYAGVYYGSPGAVMIENELINWMKSIFNFPKNAVGNLTSGGSIANLIALTAARDRHQIKNEKITKSVVYLSPQTHHSSLKALRIIGLEDVIIRRVALDKHHRIDAKNLKHQIKTDLKTGLNPFLVIASAGTTDTGAVDPINAIGDISKKYNLWYHIDGAYGGFFILVDQKKKKFDGIEKADSLVIDPHKGLFIPYGLGAVLIKDKNAVFKSHHYFANYMQVTVNDNEVSPSDLSPELTKHFRGLRLWIPLKLHGIEPFKASLEEKILLTEYFRNILSENGFILGPQPDLSVSYFWYPSKKIDQNAFNEKLLEFIHKDGRVFLSSTVLNNQFVIRIAILSFRTKKETIDKAMIMINECLAKTQSYFKI